MGIYDMNILISVIALVLNLYVATVLIIRWKGGKSNGRHDEDRDDYRR